MGENLRSKEETSGNFCCMGGKYSAAQEEISATQEKTSGNFGCMGGTSKREKTIRKSGTAKREKF